MACSRVFLEQYPNLETGFDPESLHAQLIFHHRLGLVKGDLDTQLECVEDLRFIILSLAVRTGDAETVKLALKSSSGILLIELYAKTVFEIAIEETYAGTKQMNTVTEVFRILLSSGFADKPPLYLLPRVVRLGNIDLVKLLLDHGADPHSPLYGAQSSSWPTEDAICSDQPEITNYLLSVGSHISTLEIRMLLAAAILFSDFSSLIEVIEACARLKHISFSRVIDHLGANVPAGLTILINRHGALCLQWLCDNGVDIRQLSGYFEGDHQISATFYPRLEAHRYFNYAHTLTFDQSTDTLDKLLHLGVLAGDGLLESCASSCSCHNINNVHLLLKTRDALGLPPLSTLSVSSILTRVIDKLQFQRRHLSIAKLPSSASHHFILLVLMELGALLDDPVLGFLLLSQESWHTKLAWQTIVARTSWGSAMTLGLYAVKILIESGISVIKRIEGGQNVIGDTLEGRYPLQIAVHYRKRDIMHFLLEKGADINAHSSSLEFPGTALHQAAAEGCFAMVQDVLEAGANINELSGCGYRRSTALGIAACKGRLDVLHLLIENNHDAQKLFEDCRRSAPWAKQAGHVVIADLLNAHAVRLASELGISHINIEEAEVEEGDVRKNGMEAVDVEEDDGEEGDVEEARQSLVRCGSLLTVRTGHILVLFGSSAFRTGNELGGVFRSS